MSASGVHVSAESAIGSHFSLADALAEHCTDIIASTKRMRIHDVDNEADDAIDALDATTVSAFETMTDELSTIDSTDLTRTISAEPVKVAAIV